jgi:thioredoxin-dependent peroxiredoxin
VSANASFAAKRGFPFRLLCDTERELGMLYGACDSRSALSARRVSYLVAPDGRILKAYPTVKAADHPREVLADLRAFIEPGRTGHRRNNHGV